MIVFNPLSLATAANTSGTTAAWFTLVGALGGVFLTGTIGLVTAVLNHRWQAQATGQQSLDEFQKQLRQERRETYAAYWSAWNLLIHDLQELQAAEAADVHPASDKAQQEAGTMSLRDKTRCG